MLNADLTKPILMQKNLCDDLRTIRLRRNGNNALGFAIRGGSEFGTGIFVSDVYAESEAEKEGLKRGDEILRVNGFSIEQAEHDDVINLIKSAKKVILKVKSTGMIPVKDNGSEPIQWQVINSLQKDKIEQNQMNNSIISKQYKQQKSKSKCPIHSLRKEDGQAISAILLNDHPAKLIPSKNSIELNSAGSSPTSSVSSKYSSASITSSSLSSCSKLIAKSCKSGLSSVSSSQKPINKLNKTKLNGYYSRSLSNLKTDFIDEFSLTSTSTINFTRNKSTSNLNLELASSLTPEQTPEQTASSSTEDDDLTLKKDFKSNKYATIYINLSNKESLGCSVVKGPSNYPGIFIQTVKANGVAKRAGLEVNDQIISINDLSCLSEHMSFKEAVEKIKSNKQMKLKVKKNTAINRFLEQQVTTTTNKLNRKLIKKPLLNDLSSSSSCNESASPIIGQVSSSTSCTNYSRRSNSSNKNHHFNSCNGHLPSYYMSKFSSSRNNLNTTNYLNGQFNNLSEKSSRSSLSGGSKRSIRNGLNKKIVHHSSYTNLLSSNNSTYGHRMNGYHSPVCLRHSSSNYYSQSENDYSMYEFEEQNEKKKIDLIVSKNRLNGDNYGYCKNRQFKSKSIRNLNQTSLYDCEKCNCLNYYATTDCNDLDYHKKAPVFNLPMNNNLLKQKLLCNNLSCSNLTFKSQADIGPGLSNCQQLCSMLNNQMNVLKLNHLNEDVKSKSNLELNEDLILNNKFYEKVRLEKERLAIERKKLENEQLRLKEEKDKFEREKKQIENLKQQEELKGISNSNTISNISSVAARQTTTSTTQSIGFLDEIKKLAEKRQGDNALITDTLNKTRFTNGQTGVRLLPISDGKIKQLHPDDEKRKQHEILMQEFRAAHMRMFGSKTSTIDNDNLKSDNNDSKSILVSTSILSTTTNQINLETTSSDLKSNETEINSSSKFNDKMTSITSTSSTVSSNATTLLTANKIISPPPLPPSLTSTVAINTNKSITKGSIFNGKITNGNHMNNITNGSTTKTSANDQPDGKFRKLNTFGKLVQTNDQRNLPNNVLPKNNLNGLNQNETVKILRTSSPNKKRPAPQPPRLDKNPQSNSDAAKIVKINKKDEKLIFLNENDNNNLYSKQNQIKLEDQLKNSSVETNLVNRSLETKSRFNTDLVEKSKNYLSTASSDISLSSLSIKVQVPTKSRFDEKAKDQLDQDCELGRIDEEDEESQEDEESISEESINEEELSYKDDDLFKNKFNDAIDEN